MSVLLVLYFFVLGAIFGSFALVLVDRTKRKQDWVRGRSKCSNCKRTLQARDLIPIVSWLATKGQCRYCSVRLSIAYPLTEIVLGLSFALSFSLWPNELVLWHERAGFAIWLFALLISAVLFIYDLRWFILPSSFLNLFVVLGAVYKFLLIVTNDQAIGDDIVNTLVTLVVSGGVFFILNKVSKGKWIGDGDIYLGIALGLFLNGPFEAWFAICVASLSGIIITMPKLIRSTKNLKMKVPFGPLLLFGLLIAFFYAQNVLVWYKDTFLYLN